LPSGAKGKKLEGTETNGRSFARSVKMSSVRSQKRWGYEGAKPTPKGLSPQKNKSRGNGPQKRGNLDAF